MAPAIRSLPIETCLWNVQGLGTPARRATLTLDGMKAARSLGGGADLASPVGYDGGATMMLNSLTCQKASDNCSEQTLRPTVDAWRQLKHTAVGEERISPDLLLEAVNTLFRGRGRLPTA